MAVRLSAFVWCAVASVLLCAATHVQAWDMKKGGSNWGGACSGKYQSPINVDAKNVGSGLDSEELDVYYPIVSAWYNNLQLEHTGAALSVKVPSQSRKLGYMMLHGKRHYVREFTFHAPAEHTINGEKFPLELQIVHQKYGAQGNADLSIISVLYRLNNFSKSSSSSFLDNAMYWDRLPNRKGAFTLLTEHMQLGMAMDGLHAGYYRYIGSTTTPPCTTGVVWNVLETVQEISLGQLLRVNRVFKDNWNFAQGHGSNREVQDLGGRTVTLHNHKPPGDGDGQPLKSCSALPPEDVTTTMMKKNARPATGKFVAPEDYITLQDSPTKAALSNVPKLYHKQGDDWTGLCMNGYFQSPIDIRPCHGNPIGDYEMVVKYPLAKNVTVLQHVDWTLKATGFMGQMAVGLETGKAKIFQAEAIHFHTPSEHLIDGRRADFELEIVHETPKSGDAPVQKAIINVLFRASKTQRSEFLAALGWGNLPRVAGSFVKIPKGVNLNLIEGLRGAYYSYMGSLTRPPCTQGVKHFVLRTINPISFVQLRQFRAIIEGNTRKLQASNHRGVRVQNMNYHSDAVEQHRDHGPEWVPN